MKTNQPVEFDFPEHYRGDGLKPFTIKLKYKSGEPVNLTGASIAMQLRRVFMVGVACEFNSKECADALIEIEDAINGVMKFPEILDWEINSTTYDYDLQVTDASGFVRTYLKGKWSVNRDITKGECKL